jgi:hypothetical protein
MDKYGRQKSFNADGSEKDSRRKRQSKRITQPVPTQQQTVTLPGGTSSTQSTQSRNAGDLDILQYIFDNACINEYGSFDSFIDSGIIHWWPNGRLAGANLQSRSNQWQLCGDNALPENFGNLTELWYLDIGLQGQDITRWPESIGNLFQYSIFDLVDRNGLPVWTEFYGMAWTDYQECRERYDNLKKWPHPEYEWYKLRNYETDCYNYHINLHIDGNHNLGTPGSIPTSIGNWSKLQNIFNGIGSNLPENQFEIPDVFDTITDLAAISPTNILNPTGFPLSLCYVIPNLTNRDWMHEDVIQYWRFYYGQNWNQQTCWDIWYENGTPPGTSETTINYDWNQGNNLISIPLEFQNNSLESVLGTDTAIFSDIKGSGEAAVLLPNGNWAGSLNYINPLKGYWVKVNQETVFSVSGQSPINPTYELISGNNLISFPGTSPIPIGVALQGYEGVIDAVLGSGVAANNINGNWVGSLSELQVGKGYWFQVNQDTPFQYNLMSTSSTSQNYTPMDILLPDDLSQANINDVFDDIRNQTESQL